MAISLSAEAEDDLIIVLLQGFIWGEWEAQGRGGPEVQGRGRLREWGGPGKGEAQGGQTLSSYN